MMQKYTGGYIFPKNHMQNYTRGIILWVGIFSTVTLAPAGNDGPLAITRTGFNPNRAK